MPQATATVADPADESGPGLPADARGAAAGSDFAPLLRVVRDQGLLERRTDRYVLGIAVNLVALGAVITAFVLLGDTWWSLLLTLPLAV
ncbi:acyl-CoA desaturase, partial [Streptomyces sp. SID7499]|nr:acyl-CoA desaturase [Streptomyces sp. SID7499]